MKNITLLTITLLFFSLLFFSGCTNTAAPEIPTAEARSSITTSTASDTPRPTASPKPIETIAPMVSPTQTEAPSLPCMIAFDSDREKNREIYIMGPDGKDPVKITNNPADDWDPAWSPDGSQVAFISNRENGKESGQFIYVMNADGNGVRQLSLENESKWPDWSHDGSRITYTHKGDIHVMNADGNGQSINLTDSPEEDAQSSWSPDDRQILWLSGGDNHWNLYTMNADGTNVRQLTQNGKVFDAAWTVDGQIFTHWDSQEAGCFNCVMNADGSNIKDAGGKGEIQRYLPFWTEDGHRVEVANGDILTSDNEIYLVSEIFPDMFLNLTNNPADDRNPDWPVNCGPRGKTAALDTGESKDPGQIVIGYAGDDPSQPQRKDDFQKACNEFGIQCVYGEIPELIEKGVDAIVQNSSPTAVDNFTSSLTEVQAKGIPLFVLDLGMNAKGVYSVTVDPRQWVNTSLEWMFKKMGEKGDFAYFDFQPDQNQTALIEDILGKYPGIKVVTQNTKKYNFNESKSDVHTLMDDYPNLKAIWANDSLSTIVLGMADTGISSEKWPLLRCEPTKEGLFIWKDRLKDHPGMQCISVSNPPGIAYDAAYAAYYLITGAQIDESALGGPYGNSLYVDIPVVTNDNLQEWLDKINFEDSQYVVDELMKPEEILQKWFIK